MFGSESSIGMRLDMRPVIEKLAFSSPSVSFLIRLVDSLLKLVVLLCKSFGLFIFASSSLSSFEWTRSK